MHYRPFGSTGLTTSEVGFGCARIGGVFQSSSRAEIVALLRRALDAGITLFDTADMYTQGESERLVGDAFRGNRQRVLIATKFGYPLTAQTQLVSRLKPLMKPLVARLGLKSRQIHPGRRGPVSQQDFSAAYIMRAVEASLRRLKTDYIDLYQLHDPPVEVLQRGEFVEPLELLKRQGKVRHWGVACHVPEDVLPSLHHAALASIQVGLSVLEQAALDTAIPRAADSGVAVIARQVFASGLLTRPAGSLQLHDIDSQPVVASQKHQQLHAYALIALQCGRSQAEMALQFALARHDISVVVLGISRPGHLEETLRILNASGLSPEEQQLLIASRRADP